MNDSPRVLGNRYEVGDLLGRGGMAEVHLGHDARLGRTVAIKLLRNDLARDPMFQARFRREAQSAAALNHPAIVAVYDTGEESVVEAGGAIVNLPYIVMEYVEGRTLREELGHGSHLDVDSSLAVITGVLAALEYSHRIGIVHRDIKPANVMLTPNGEIKVMDFGIARAMADASSTMTQTQAVIGTAQYLSPEQARGEQVDTRSDLYSAGCLLFELLTGRPPFVADSPVAVAYQHVREMPVPPSQLVAGIPESVDRIVLHALAKGREERYQTAAEFRNDVEAARGGRQVMATVPVLSTSDAAATQYMPAQEGTRAMPPVAGGGLLPGGGATETNPQVLDPLYGAPGDDVRPRDRRGSSRRAPIFAGIAVLVVLLLVGFAIARTLGGGNDTATVPAVKGVQVDVARTSLTDAGFTATPTISEQPSTTVAENAVISSSPAQGQVVDADTVITLVVSTGPDSVKVPDVTGESPEDAEAELKKVELHIGRVTSVDDPSEDEGDVVSSKPAPGRSVKKGATVNLQVASGNVKVPNLKNMSTDEAHAALDKLHLRANDTFVPNRGKAAGTVLDQDYPAGASLPVDSTVTLSIAAKDEPTPTPTPTPTEAPTTPESTVTVNPTLPFPTGQ